jgi:hypothetical protein
VESEELTKCTDTPAARNLLGEIPNVAHQDASNSGVYKQGGNGISKCLKQIALKYIFSKVTNLKYTASKVTIMKLI